MPLTDMSVRDLLTAFSSSDPTPGGGSASALAAAVGASLLMMVAGLPKTRNGSDEDRERLAQAAHRLEGVRQSLADAVDEDTAAYNQVVAAYKRPKGSDDEKAARKAAIQQALRAATEVPRRVVEASLTAIQLGETVAAHGNRSASSDVGVAIALLRAGAEGARRNVDTNLDSLADVGYRETVRETTGRSMQAVGDAAARAESLLRV